MSKIRFFNVCPFHTALFGAGTIRPAEEYLQDLQQHATWADQHGLYGIVVYNFNTSLDPLLTTQAVLSVTQHLRPLVAVQSALIHPFALMRALATLVYLYGRGVDLNVVAGASPGDLRKIGEELGEEDRYERQREYIRALRALSEGETTFEGRYFKLKDASMQPALLPANRPQIYVPGSSSASCQTVQAFAHSSLLMAKPFALISEEIARLNGQRSDLRHAMIVGVVTRATRDQAWEAITSSIPIDRRTRLINRMFVANSSSSQHRVNLELADKQEVFDGLLWYGSAKIGTDAPKLVGSYAEVREALKRYRELGITDIILDLPDHISEYNHMLEAIGPLMAPVNPGGGQGEAEAAEVVDCDELKSKQEGN